MQPSRNDPCPCGSGKKYKKCCMNNSQPVSGLQRLKNVRQISSVPGISNILMPSKADNAPKEAQEPKDNKAVSKKSSKVKKGSDTKEKNAKGSRKAT